MRRLLLVVASLAVFSGGCGSSDSPHPLEGTWNSTGPARVGQTGTTWHSFHGDGSIASNINVFAADSGCRSILTLVGTFTTGDGVLDIEYTSGTSETAHCIDEATNSAESPFDAETLTSFATNTQYTLDGDTVNFVGDGATSVLSRVTG